MPKVRVYSTRACGPCAAAKRYLTQVKGVEFEDIDVSYDAERRQWLRQATGRSTVPQIFVGERSIGGYDDLRALDARGELDALLAAA